ncbi:EAL domain-containing protein [Alkalicella caledoniensis]|uniref:EAL domain-containing protein n=1 Tax=Alkalicella caledoniensis TaxID=2731377 RepID=A0A7G9WBA5_ALKCA|nr:GGDEF domain-containing phosphodiesterase [Alkalicella caledoniensis]QNO15967.1 EAL domain-containing protein [Alkalicella caledoniensis]
MGLLNFLNNKLKSTHGEEGETKKIVLKIVAAYGVIGIFWIIVSDRLLYTFIGEPKTLQNIQEYKGIFYVLITMFFIYRLVYTPINLLTKSNKRIKETNFKLMDTYSELAATEEELIAQLDETKAINKRYQLLIEGSKDGIWEWDLLNDKFNFSIVTKPPFNYAVGEIQGGFEQWSKLIHPDDKEKANVIFNKYLGEKSGTYRSTYRLRCKDGSYRWILSQGQAEWDVGGKAIRVAGSHTDLTETIDLKESLHKLYYYDNVTDLPNRQMIKMKIEDKIAEFPKEKFALVCFDIDNFKHINDTLGHFAGDELLRYVAKVLKVKLDSVHRIARLGGDEFLILLEYSEISRILAVTEELVTELRKPWHFQDKEFHISLSAGIVTYPDHGSNFDALLKNADSAMYAVKENGKDNFGLYTDEEQQRRSEYMEIVNDLHHAIDKKQFELFYQPILNLESRKVIAVEALIRWFHPEKGFIPPDKFIPIAEQTGQIHEINSWVLRTACTQKKKWEQMGFEPITFSINFSCKSFTQVDPVKNTQMIINESGVKYDEIQLEITETSLIENFDLAIDTIRELSERGIKFALDDFGTGYSSFTYLKKLPIDCLKIDRDFLLTIEMDKTNEIIVNKVIELAHVLGMKVIAEGIETVEQLEVLKKYGCDRGQGYYFSKPLPSSHIEEFLVKQ